MKPLNKNEKSEEKVEERLSESQEDKDVVIQAIDELADRASEIDKLKDELEQTTDKWKRQAAEFQNYRRRTEQEKARAVSLGKSLVIQQFLDVVDDFHRSLEATAQAESESEGELSAAYQSLKSGVECVSQQLRSDLDRLDVHTIHSGGQLFDED